MGALLHSRGDQPDGPKAVSQSITQAGEKIVHNETEEIVPNDLIDHIDEIVRERSLLKHPFYQAWTEGTLPLDSLKGYAAQYFHFEAAYPTFLSGIHHRCSDRRIRQLLLDNLWDEEHGPDNHVELWLRFCEALGLDRDEVLVGEPADATADLIGTYEEVTSRAPLAAGAAALYAYESQVPEVARVKLQGLRQFYSLDDGDAVSFFKVHQTLDEEHSEAEKEMVLALASTEHESTAAVDAVDQATKALWRFLDGVY